MNVDLDTPAVDQLWDEVNDIIEIANLWMVLLLKVSVVEEGNGILSFTVSIDTPGNLHKLIKQFFCSSKKDTRGGEIITMTVMKWLKRDLVVLLYPLLPV